MSPRLFLLLLLPACAGPSAHQTPAQGSALATSEPEAARTEVASTLATDDPLAVSNCGLPAAPNPACAEAEKAPPASPEKKPDPHQHHHHESMAPSQTPEAPSAARAPPPEAAAATTVVDPVCKMKIDPSTAAGGSLTHEGTKHWFCSSSCKRKFLSQHPGAK